MTMRRLRGYVAPTPTAAPTAAPAPTPEVKALARELRNFLPEIGDSINQIALIRISGNLELIQTLLSIHKGKFAAFVFFEIAYYMFYNNSESLPERDRHAEYLNWEPLDADLYNNLQFFIQSCIYSTWQASSVGSALREKINQTLTLSLANDERDCAHQVIIDTLESYVAQYRDSFTAWLKALARNRDHLDRIFLRAGIIRPSSLDLFLFLSTTNSKRAAIAQADDELIPQGFKDRRRDRLDRASVASTLISASGGSVGDAYKYFEWLLSVQPWGSQPPPPPFASRDGLALRGEFFLREECNQGYLSAVSSSVHRVIPTRGPHTLRELYLGSPAAVGYAPDMSEGAGVGGHGSSVPATPAAAPDMSEGASVGGHGSSVPATPAAAPDMSEGAGVGGHGSSVPATPAVAPDMSEGARAGSHGSSVLAAPAATPGQSRFRLPPSMSSLISSLISSLFYHSSSSASFEETFVKEVLFDGIIIRNRGETTETSFRQLLDDCLDMEANGDPDRRRRMQEDLCAELKHPDHIRKLTKNLWFLIDCYSKIDFSHRADLSLNPDFDLVDYPENKQEGDHHLKPLYMALHESVMRVAQVEKYKSSPGSLRRMNANLLATCAPAKLRLCLAQLVKDFIAELAAGAPGAGVPLPRPGKRS